MQAHPVQLTYWLPFGPAVRTCLKAHPADLGRPGDPVIRSIDVLVEPYLKPIFSHAAHTTPPNEEFAQIMMARLARLRCTTLLTIRFFGANLWTEVSRRHRNKCGTPNGCRSERPPVTFLGSPPHGVSVIVSLRKSSVRRILPHLRINCSESTAASTNGPPNSGQRS